MSTRYGNINDARFVIAPYATPAKAFPMKTRPASPGLTVTDRRLLKRLSAGPAKITASATKGYERIGRFGLAVYREKTETWELTAKGWDVVKGVGDGK